MRGLKAQICKKQLEALRRVPLEKQNKTKKTKLRQRREEGAREGIIIFRWWKDCQVPVENHTPCGP